ncbi:hypothetical protein, partial [Pseudomonas syringae group genomosp. 7]|uniref:hypothetical protein n=1 Tax=Pseudomonas syringae group genomosp. 7 TaxID=251699 RepID=UPI0037701CA9
MGVVVWVFVVCGVCVVVWVWLLWGCLCLVCGGLWAGGWLWVCLVWCWCCCWWCLWGFVGLGCVWCWLVCLGFLFFGCWVFFVVGFGLFVLLLGFVVGLSLAEYLGRLF